MNIKINDEDIAVLKDIAANQLSPMSKMKAFIGEKYQSITALQAEAIAKDILDQVAASFGFQTKYSKPCSDMKDETKAAEEIKKAGIWLSKQNYQREQGEQEYMMYFDVDIPEMLAKYSSEQLTQQQETIAELKKQNAELVEALERLKEGDDEGWIIPEKTLLEKFCIHLIEKGYLKDSAPVMVNQIVKKYMDGIS